MSEQNPKRMAGFRIDNGFPDTKSRGCILVGVLLNGDIKKEIC